MSTGKKTISRREFLKLSGTALGGAVGAAALAACAAPPAAAPTAAPTSAPGGAKAPAVLKGATINYLGYAMFVPKMNEVFQAFALDWATQNNVKFNWELATTSDIASRVATTIEAKRGPNIVQYASPPASWASGFVDLTSLANDLASQQEGWYPTAPAVSTLDGKWYAIPMGSNTPMINWRTDWFKEVGYDAFPDTWDAVLEAGKKLKAAGHPFGWVFAGAKAPFDGMSNAFALLWAFGGQEFKPDGTLILDSPETIAAMEFAIKLHKEVNDPGATAYNDSTNNTGFLAGQMSVAYNVNTIYLPALTDKPDVAKVMDHALPPKGPAGRFNYQGYPFVSVLKHTEGRDLDAALQFLRDLFDVRNYSKYIKEGRGYLVPLAPIYENLPVWDTDPKLKLAKEIGKIGRWAGYALPSPSKLSSLMASQFTISNMFSNAVTTGNARAALDTTLKEIETLKK